MQKKHTPIISEFNIKKKIGYLKPHCLAKKLGLTKRQYRKCNVVDLLLGHWQLISLGQFSYDNWATQISSITGKIISGQAICKRMVNETTFFLTELLNKSMQQKYFRFLWVYSPQEKPRGNHSEEPGCPKLGVRQVVHRTRQMHLVAHH